MSDVNDSPDTPANQGTSGKPGDRPLPDGSGNYNPDGTLRDLDAEERAKRYKIDPPIGGDGDPNSDDDGA